MKDKLLHRNVILTGFTSFFTDVSSEMIYPLLQAFIATIMAAQTVLLGPVLGIIEGLAESTASITKVFSGYFSDRLGKRKNISIAGYGTSAVSKILFLLASLGWYIVLLARFFDRIGKGIRTAPRDALISESTPKNMQGRAFGFQRGMDFAGAAVGAIICYFLVVHFLDPDTGGIKDLWSYNIIFMISIIPALVGVVFLFFIKEMSRAGAKPTEKSPKDLSGKKAGAKKEAARPSFNLGNYPKGLQVFFLAQAFFTLGNSTNQFLLLRSMLLGAELPLVILMYLVFNTASTILSPVFGSLSDKVGKKNVLLIGYSLYALVYMAFGFITTQVQFLLWIFWPVYGIYYALTEGVEKAFVSELAPAGSRATALGFYHTITGVGLLPASALAGLLFMFGQALPFIFGGGMAVITVLIIVLFVKKPAPGRA
jgi:MFS family permease